jgi:Caspase domain/Sel1 repeat
MNVRNCFFFVAVVVVAVSLLSRADAQGELVSDDPLRHGHALLIGNAHYKDPRWPQLDDVPLQLNALRRGLRDHFDSVEVAADLELEELRETINAFLRTYGDDRNARLFIYYAGHGYTEIINERNENRGYITGIDTPALNGTAEVYNAARRKAISMGQISAMLEDVLAKSILVVFDSCFAGTIFTDRAGNDPPPPLIPEVVARLLQRPARDIITAGRSDQRVPAHSPIPDLFLSALNGGADPYRHGVISSVDIYIYLLDRVLRMANINLTPQQGRLPHPAFAEGTFLFRVINPAIPAPNDNETVRLYRAEAEKGDVTAQLNLARLYYDGKEGLPRDEHEAARLFKLAANQGNAAAQTSLAFFYEQGIGGVAKDDREAARLYRLAADQGNPDAQTSLATFYTAGRGGLPKNEREATRLFKLAADQGHVAFVSSTFSTGMRLPGRDFAFGQDYESINALLDHPFGITSYESLVKADEYNPDEVRYLWVYLDDLPTLKSALGTLARDPKCIDPLSYIVFFFKNGIFFRTSLKLFRGADCQSYDWLHNALFSPGQDTLNLAGDKGVIGVLYHEVRDFSALEIFQKGVARDDLKFFGAQ